MDNEAVASGQQEPEQSDCVIVGGGPGGAVLALLLARQGIDVTLLERHADFDRDFRGDSLQIAVLELMDELGLAERLLELPHSKIPRLTIRTAEGERTIADFGKLRTRYPYIVTMPQAVFLDFIVSEASRYPNFHLVLNANVQGLIKDAEVVKGVRYHSPDGEHSLRANLTVGADGRNSQVRRLAGLELIKIAAPLDIIWLRLPRLSPDEQMPALYAGRGYHVNVIARPDSWQIGYTFPKGEYRKLREAGIASLRENLARAMPDFAERLNILSDWRQVSFLAIESARVNRWYKPGLILIGDAAHVLSPFVGAGINFAIQDAVAVANQVSVSLRAGKAASVRELAAVERQRQWPVRLVQWLDAILQHGISGGRQDDAAPVQYGVGRPGQRGAGHAGGPAFTRLPFIEKIYQGYIGYGIGRVRLKAKGVVSDKAVPGHGGHYQPATSASFPVADRGLHQSQSERSGAARASLLLRLHNAIGQANVRTALPHMRLLLLAAMLGIVLRLIHNAQTR